MGTSAHAERRHTPRRPFRGNVELALVDDADGYEADGVDVSIGGMALKTAYLPDVGSELECRFALEDGAPVVARGEVVWAVDAGADAGQFGLRFTDLATADEQAITNTFKKSRAPSPAPSPSRDARPVAAGSPPAADENRARLHIRGMEAPLRARVRTQMDDVIVLGSDLSFLKLGDRVEVERNGDRVGGSIEDVSVEVDGQTRVARLVLTVATGAGKPTIAPVVDEGPRGPSTLEARRATVPLGAPAPSPSIVPASAGLPRSEPQRVSRPAQATAVLTPEPAHIAPPPVSIATDSAPDLDGPEVELSDAGDTDEAPARARNRATPPAWLVSALGTLRSTGASLARVAGPALARVLPLVLAISARIVAFVRAKISRGNVVESVPTTAPARGMSSVTLRKQQPATAAATPERAASPARRRYGMYALAAVGAAALAFAVVLQQREPPPATPHPQVAVPGADNANVADNAVANANAAAPAADPNAPTPGGDPTNVANAAAGPNGVDPGAMGQGEPEAAAQPAVAPAAPRAARGLPTDLAAAARSRNADVNDEPPTITSAAARPSAANAHPAVASAHVAAPPPAHAGAHTLGSTNIRGGTVLRLHMDGTIAGIAGGTSAPNALTFRLAGRQSLDHAAPLVHQDARLINAGVRNRAAGAEVTLRFRDAAPAFFARARGDVLEIVLAPGASAPHHPVAAPAHAVPARASTHAAPVAHPSAHAAPAPAHAAAPRARR